MSKWFGAIGFCDTVESVPGIWEEQIIEKNYYGDIVKNNRRFSEQSDSTNDNITVDNQLSVLADPYIHENLHRIRYVCFMGAKWKITSFEIQYPRIVLTLGGEYNG